MRGIIINPLLSQRLALSSLFRFLFSVAAKGYYFIAKNINAIAFIGFVAGYFFVLSSSFSEPFPREASGLSAAMLAFAIGFPVRYLTRKIGWLDQPSGRKNHAYAVPLGGGIVIVVGILGGAITSKILSPTIAFERSKEIAFGLGLFLTLALGIFDDIKNLSAGKKLFCQLAIGLMMWFLGFKIQKFSVPFMGSVDIGFLSLFLTVFWYAALMNALNLIDGLDGLACGIAAIAAITILGIASIWASKPSFLYSAVFIGACLGFLPHNFHPARIFLGDAGSLVLGFCLATLTLETGTKSHAFLALLIPLLAVFLPVADAIYAFMRRIANGTSPFKGDRKHLHHRLVAIGLSKRRAVIILYYISVLSGVLAYLLSKSSPGAILVVVALFIGGFFLFIQSIVKIQRANIDNLKNRKRKLKPL